MSDRRKKAKLFGTDGIRGKANHSPMTGEIAFEVGRAAAYVLRKKNGLNKILIGKDTRLSGYMLESARTSGICSMGMNVILPSQVYSDGHRRIRNIHLSRSLCLSELRPEFIFESRELNKKERKLTCIKMASPRLNH